MPLMEIATWIENHTGWVIGEDFFVGYLPIELPGGGDVPVRCLTALWRGGAPEGQLPDRIDAQIELLSRAADYPTAEENAQALYELIHGTHGWNLPVLTSGEAWLAMVVDALSAPYPVQNPDPKGRFTFSANYIWRLERATC